MFPLLLLQNSKLPSQTRQILWLSQLNKIRGRWCPPPPLSSGLQSTISFTSANGESDYDPLPICTFNDLDIFITDASKRKIWNSEYIDLALLLRQNFCPNTDTMGTLTVVNNQLTVKIGAPKIKVPINSIELWTDAFSA